MKKVCFFLLFFFSFAVVLAQKNSAKTDEHCAVDTIKGSPARQVADKIGANAINIQYHSPGVKGRIIWGGLVAYNKVWATGAHNATNMTFSQDVVINGTRIKAGKYAFFTIPDKKSWTLIINKNWEQHLADEYDQKEDIIRFTVKPQKLKSEVSRLAYYIKPTSDKEGTISMAWEKLQINFVVKNAE